MTPERGAGRVPARQFRRILWLHRHDGRTVIAPQFENAELFSGSLAMVTVGDKYGYVDETGTVVTPLFDGAWTFSEGLAAVRIGDLRGYIDRTGKVVIEPRSEVAGSFVEGLAPVRLGASGVT